MLHLKESKVMLSRVKVAFTACGTECPPTRGHRTVHFGECNQNQPGALAA